MGLFVQITQLFLSLTILITLHELGHYWFAKRFGCKVEKFYLFFDFLFPIPSLLKFSLFKKKIGDTEYGLGWFPLGGYVQIAGMMDEQMDKSLIDKAPEPWELRSKPAWQRLLVMIGGILVNLLLGLLIFWMVLFAWGKEVLPVKNLPYGIMVDSAAYKLGLRNGDIITSLDGKPVTTFNRITVDIIMNGVATIEGTRANGENFQIPVTDYDRSVILKSMKRTGFIRGRYVAKVDSVLPDHFAKKAGVKKGDIFLAVNDKPVKFFDEFKEQLVLNKKSEVSFKLLRGKDTVNAKCSVNTEGQIGISPGQTEAFKTETKTFGFFEALAESIYDAVELIVLQAKQFVVLFTVKDSYEQVGGFYTMVQQMSDTWDWQQFWRFTAIFSLALAFMNFLPIPMLDGGYIMFIAWEMITRRRVPDKVIYYANTVGLVIVLSLMVYANLDWSRK